MFHGVEIVDKLHSPPRIVLTRPIFTNWLLKLGTPASSSCVGHTCFQSSPITPFGHIWNIIFHKSGRSTFSSPITLTVCGWKKSTLMSKRQTWVEFLYFARLIDFFQFHRPVHFWVSVFILIFSHPCDQAKLFLISLLSSLWSTSCCFSCDLAECVNVGSGHWCYGDIASYQNIPSISNIQPSGHKISIEIPSQEKY